MPVKPRDLRGQKFGRLTPIKYVLVYLNSLDKNGKRIRIGKWECLCDCGNTTVVERSKLHTGHTKSCGCLRREKLPKVVESLTQERLKELLHYNPSTGIFIWKVKRGSVHPGTPAGGLTNNGYLQITISFANNLAHRLAFLYMEGYLPEHTVDHLNGIRDDNRWANLRHVTYSCNLQNTKIRACNKAGYTGLSWDKNENLWRVDLRAFGKSYFLGRHKDPLEAALTRLTCEVWHPLWTCNHRSELVIAIQKAWPEFNERSVY